MSSSVSIDHRLDDGSENIHVGYWDKSLDPVLSVEPGDVVRFECRDAANGYFDAESTVADLESGPSAIHPLTGPVEVQGATPGDVLAVEFLEFEHSGFGVSYFYPGDVGRGLLPETFDEPGLYIWDLEEEVGRFVDGIEVPLHPFPGIVGLAPADPGTHSTVPPRRVGGNIDVKHLTAGSTLYLPVEVDGALCSIGDCHAAQGDGEVCVTGIEAPMSVTARFELRPEFTVAQPEFETAASSSTPATHGQTYGTTGIADDLLTASKRAISHMIDHLHSARGLDRGDAYILCSAAVDLKINQLVNEPNLTVSAYLPEAMFPE